MAEEKEPQRDSRPPPRKRDDSEKALGLEVARLFGMNPRQLIERKSTPKADPTPDDPEDPEPEEEPSSDPAET
jgi:hypothetical protein